MSSFNEDAPNNDSITKAGYKHTDVGLIPLDWALVDMEQIASIIDPQPDHRTPPESSSGEPYIGISDFLNSFKVDWDSSRKIIRSAVDKQQARFQIDKGDIVFGKIGTIGVPKFVPEVSFRFALSANVILLKPKIEPNFLMAFFYSDLFNRVLKSELHSTSQAAFGINKMRFIKVPLPNKQEQTAIANALSDVDALIQELEKLIAKKQAIKTATMQQLLTGRTRLPQFAHHPDGRKKGYKPSELGEIPEDWEVVPMGSVGLFGRGRVISHMEINRSISRQYPVYSSQTSNYGIMGYLDSYDFDGEYITWTTDGVNAGKVFYRSGKFNCTNVCGVISIKSEDAGYIAIAMSLESRKYVSTNLANPKLMNGEAKKVLIKKPNIKDEQIAIASIFRDMDEDIIALEQRLNKTRQIKQGMMQELLTGKTRLVKAAGAA